MLAAVVAMMAAPAAIGAVAPKNFWLRALYAAFFAGVLLAIRRLMAQAGAAPPFIDENVVLLSTAFAAFALALGAPLWRAALALSLIGLAAVVLGLAGALSVVAVETVRVGTVETAGASLALAAAFGAALSIEIAAAFGRLFAEGGANRDAAAAAARHAAAPALFALCVGVAAIALAAFATEGSPADILGAARVAAGTIAFALAAPLFMLAGALSIKAATEMTAVNENRRRAALRPFLRTVRFLLPPSSAIAASAMFLILAVIAAFETQEAASAGEIALVSAVGLIAAVVFVSMRTALLAALLVAGAGRLASWGVDLAGLAPLTETARIVATALAAVLSMQLFLAWRDRRNPRRKTREVVAFALADSLFAYAAASILAVSAMAASEAAGIWSEGAEAALYAGLLALIGFFAAPPLMTAIGALFGRE